MKKLNRQYERAKIKGLIAMLRDCQNGRTVHDLKNIETALSNWHGLLSKRAHINEMEIKNLNTLQSQVKEIIRREMEIKNKTK